MIEPKFVEMMNMELDGVLPEPDRVKLREYLSSDPQATDYFEGLRAALSAVDAVGQVEPPDGLNERIIEAVPFTRHHTETPRRGFSSWRQNWFSPPRLRYAAVGAFGIVLGGFLYSAVNYDSRQGSGELKITDFVGSMTQITTSDGFRQTGVFDVELDRVKGSVTLHESQEVLLAEVALDADGEIDWVIEYDANNVTLDGYRSFKHGAPEVLVGNAQLRVHQKGDSHYLVYFTRQPHPVTPIVVKIYSADQLLLEHAVSPAAKSAY